MNASLLGHLAVSRVDSAETPVAEALLGGHGASVQMFVPWQTPDSPHDPGRASAVPERETEGGQSLAAATVAGHDGHRPGVQRLLGSTGP